MPANVPLHRVVIDLDPAMLIRSGAHHADLIREFQLIAMGAELDGAEHKPLPGRLADLINEMLRDYRGVQSANLAQAQEARERGEQQITLVMDLPEAAIDAVQHICGALEEADAYCREGDSLLTLSAPPEVVALRRWFADEIGRQIRASMASEATHSQPHHA